MNATDPALWTIRPVHGVAGGPDEVVLTAEGLERAFSVGAQVRRGAPAAALAALSTVVGDGVLSVRTGTHMAPAPLAAFGMVVWSHLQDLGYVERWYCATRGDGVRLTAAGRAAIESAKAEQARLLERCKRTALPA